MAIDETTGSSDCPFCDGAPPPDRAADAPGRRLAPRRACARHRDEAVLPWGGRVADLAPAAIGEAGALNYVLNPVSVDGRRAWLDVSGGRPVVQEEVFPSERFVEYLLQHRTDLVEYLDALRRTPACLAALADLSAGREPPLEPLIEIASMLSRAHDAQFAFARDLAIRAELARRGVPAARSLSDAAFIVAAAALGQSPIDRPPAEYVELLRGLIARRFSG